MRTVNFALAAALALTATTTVVSAQTLSQRAEEQRRAKEAAERAKAAVASGTVDCANADPNKEEECLRAANDHIKLDNKQQKQIADLTNGGSAKAKAGDIAGALADYDAATAVAPTHPLIIDVNRAKSVVLRDRATRTYNAAVAGGAPTVPAETLAAVGADLKASIAASSAAATTVLASKDPKQTAKLPAISADLRETARLWASMDRAAVTTAPRPSIDTEVMLFRQWLDATPAPSAKEVGMYGPGVAAALFAKDRDAGLELAEEVMTKAPDDPDTVIAFAVLVRDANLPATDPRHTRALSAVRIAEGSGIGTPNQKIKLKNARIRLNNPNV